MIVSAVASDSDPEIVMEAAFMTLALTISLTVYAFTTKTDYTYLGATLFIFLCALIMFGIFSWIFYYDMLYTTYIVLGVILYSYYLIYDTQLIAGGNHRHF